MTRARHGGRVRAAEGVRRRRRARCTGTGDDAAGHGGRRDLPAEGPAGAELARLPDRHAARPGGDQAGQPAGGATPASSRACSPRTWPTCRTSTTGSTACPRRSLAVTCPHCGSRAQRGGAAAGGIAGYPVDRVHHEVAFLGRHVHWTLDRAADPRPRAAAALGARGARPAATAEARPGRAMTGRRRCPRR